MPVNPDDFTGSSLFTSYKNELLRQLAEEGTSGNDVDAIHDNVAAEINALTAKSTIIDADEILIEDSETAPTAYSKKKSLFSAIWTYIKTKADLVYSALGHTHSDIHTQGTDSGTTGNTFTVDSDSTTGKIVLDVALNSGENHTMTITNDVMADDVTITLPAATGTVALTSHNHSGTYEPANSNIQSHIGVVAGNPHGTTYSDVGASASGHTHDYSGTFLGINAKAADSDKLDGNDSSAFATSGHTHTDLHTQGTDTGTTNSSFTIDSDATTGKIAITAVPNSGENHTMTLQNAVMADDVTLTLPATTGTLELTSHTHASLHTQNTDTGTTGNTFTIDSDSTTGKMVFDVALNANEDHTMTITNIVMTSDVTITFPATTGTVALTSDIVANIVEPSTEAGQILFGDSSGGYDHSETSEMYWDDVNKVFFAPESKAYSALLANPNLVQDSYTELLLHCDGSGANFIDSSYTTKTITAYGTATQSATQSKFGGLSAYLNGAGNYLSTTHANFSLGYGDFTLECWIYPTSLPATYNHIIDTRTSDPVGFALGVESNGKLFFFSGAFRIEAGSVSLNTWQHIALVNASGTVTLYLGGTSVGSWSGSPNYTTTTILIGKYYNGTTYPWNGYVDELRLSKGLARWSGNFTPPASAYSTTSGRAKLTAPTLAIDTDYTLPATANEANTFLRNNGSGVLNWSYANYCKLKTGDNFQVVDSTGTSLFNVDYLGNVTFNNADGWGGQYIRYYTFKTGQSHIFRDSVGSNMFTLPHAAGNWYLMFHTPIRLAAITGVAKMNTKADSVTVQGGDTSSSGGTNIDGGDLYLAGGSPANSGNYGIVYINNNTTGITCTGGLYTVSRSVTLADDATIDLISSKTGWGFVQIGDNQEWARFSFTSAGVVTLESSSTNVALADTDGNLCLIDNGSNVRFKNRLGSSLTIRYEVKYS